MTIAVTVLIVLCTGLILSIFQRGIAKAEGRFIVWAANLTSTTRWFTAWVLIFPIWAIGRAVLLSTTKWYTADDDMVVLALLFSAAPFFVENLLKITTAKQMTELQKQSARILVLTEAVRAALDRSEERDELLRDLVTQLLDRMESAIPQSVIDLAIAVRARLPDEADTQFHALVRSLADEILKHPEVT